MTGRSAIRTYRNIFLIYNPAAGSLVRRGERLLNQSLQILEQAGHKVTAVPTTGPQTAGGIARRCLESGADLILAAGGDGTINEVINGMAGSQVPMGILPGGTANMLAVELGLGPRMQRAASLVGACDPERVSLGLLQCADTPPRHFLLMAGIGLDAHIVYSLNLKLKSRLGKLAYWLAGFGQLERRLEEFQVEAGGRRVTASFALASRVRNYGGDLEIATTANLLEPVFALVLFEGAQAYRYLRYFVGVLTRSLERMEGVTVLHVDRLSCSGPPGTRVYVQVDGEYAGRLPATAQIVPDSLTLLLPPDFRDRARPPRHG